MIEAIEAEVVGGETGDLLTAGLADRGVREGPWVLSTDRGQVDTGELRHRLRKRRVAQPTIIKRFTPLLWVQYGSAERNSIENFVILQELRQQPPTKYRHWLEVGRNGDPGQPMSL
jgi:hypothetical protein